MKQSIIGQNIKEARIEAGLTQLQLAGKCRLDIRTIQRIESGKVFPRFYTLNLISETLGKNFKITFNEIEKPSTKFDKLSWKKNILSSHYNIISNNKPIGSFSYPHPEGHCHFLPTAPVRLIATPFSRLRST